MCGRYYVEPESDMAELAELIAEAKRKSEEVKTGEVFPSDTAAVIANNRQLKPTVFPMRWGFERRGGGLVINARSETAAEKQLFRESAQLRRCLIPASCYFEWERRADGKVKYSIRPRGKELLYLGGLYTKPEPGALPRSPSSPAKPPTASASSMTVCRSSCRRKRRPTGSRSR